MVVIDGDKLRAERWEKLGGPVPYVFAGEKFALSPEMPLALTDTLQAAVEEQWPRRRFLHTACATLFLGAEESMTKPASRDAEWQRFLALQPNLDDLDDLLQFISRVYAGEMDKVTDDTEQRVAVVEQARTKRKAAKKAAVKEAIRERRDD